MTRHSKGAKQSDSTLRAGIAAPFHPKINGMRATAAEVFRQITGEEPEVTEYAEPDPDALVLNQP